MKTKIKIIMDHDYQADNYPSCWQIVGKKLLFWKVIYESPNLDNIKHVYDQLLSLPEYEEYKHIN